MKIERVGTTGGRTTNYEYTLSDGRIGQVQIRADRSLHWYNETDLGLMDKDKTDIMNAIRDLEGMTPQEKRARTRREKAIAREFWEETEAFLDMNSICIEDGQFPRV